MRKRALEMLKNNVFGGDNIWYNRPRNDAAWCQFCCAIHRGNIAIHKAWSLSNFTGNFFFIFYISTSISCSQAFSLRKWTVCIKYTQVYTYDTHECMQCKHLLHTTGPSDLYDSVVSSIFYGGIQIPLKGCSHLCLVFEEFGDDLSCVLVLRNLIRSH